MRLSAQHTVPIMVSMPMLRSLRALHPLMASAGEACRVRPAIDARSWLRLTSTWLCRQAASLVMQCKSLSADLVV